jgi:hypothetical protein
MYCQGCGSQLNQGANFCNICGTKISITSYLPAVMSVQLVAEVSVAFPRIRRGFFNTGITCASKGEFKLWLDRSDTHEHILIGTGTVTGGGSDSSMTRGTPIGYYSSALDGIAGMKGYLMKLADDLAKQGWSVADLAQLAVNFNGFQIMNLYYWDGSNLEVLRYQHPNYPYFILANLSLVRK